MIWTFAKRLLKNFSVLSLDNEHDTTFAKSEQLQTLKRATHVTLE